MNPRKIAFGPAGARGARKMSWRGYDSPDFGETIDCAATCDRFARRIRTEDSKCKKGADLKGFCDAARCALLHEPVSPMRRRVSCSPRSRACL